MRQIVRAIAVSATASLVGCASAPEVERPNTLRGDTIYDSSGKPLSSEAELPLRLVDENGRTWVRMPDIAGCRGMQTETLQLRGSVYIPEHATPTERPQ